MRQRAPLGRPPQKGKGEREVAGSSSKAAALGGGRDVAITGVGNYVDAQNDENDETNNNVASNFGGGYAREKRTDYLAKFTRKKLNSNPVKILDKTILDKSSTKKRLAEYDRVEAQVVKEREVDSSVKETVLEGLTRSWTMLGDITICATVNANVPSSLVMRKELLKNTKDGKERDVPNDVDRDGSTSDGIATFNETIASMIYSMQEANDTQNTEIFEDEKEVKLRVDAALELLTTFIDSQDAALDEQPIDISVTKSGHSSNQKRKTETIKHTLYESVPIEKKRENLRSMRLNDMKVESRGFIEGFLGSPPASQQITLNGGFGGGNVRFENAPPTAYSAPPVDDIGEEIIRISPSKPSTVGGLLEAGLRLNSSTLPLGDVKLYDDINAALKTAALQRSRTPVIAPINSEEIEMYHNLYSLCNKAIGEIDSVVDCTLFDASKNVTKLIEDQNYNNHIYNHNMKQLHDNVNDAARAINSMSASISSSHELPLPSIAIGIDGYRTASAGNTFDEYSQQLQTLQMLQQQQIQQQQIQLQQLHLQLSPFLQRSPQHFQQQQLLSDPTPEPTRLNIDPHFYNNFGTYSVNSAKLAQQPGDPINYSAFNSIREQEYPSNYSSGNAVANASALINDKGGVDKQQQKQTSNKDALKMIRIKQWNDNFARDINYDIINEEKMRKRDEVAENYRVRKELLEKKKMEEMNFIKAKSYFQTDLAKQHLVQGSVSSSNKGAASDSSNNVAFAAARPPDDDRVVMNAARARRPSGSKPSVSSRVGGGGASAFNFYAQGQQGLHGLKL